MEIDINHHNNIPIQKVTISGPLLSSLLLHLTTTTSTTTGLLFGHLSLLSPPPLSDDSPLSTTTTTTSPSHSLTISSFSSSHHHHHHQRPVGLFSSRHHSPLRPSLLDSSLSLSSPYHILLLLSSPPSPSSPIHSLDFRAFSIPSFDPLPIDILNIGPAFRANYTSFSPNSTFPHLPCETRGLGLGLGLGSPMREDSKETLSELKRVAKDQKELDSYAEGFDVGGLSRLLGADAAGYVSGVEELYEKMLAKLEGLARSVEGSSAKVLDQENHNMKLRYKVAGLE